MFQIVSSSIIPSGVTSTVMKHQTGNDRRTGYNVLMLYSQALTAQLIQTTVCNGLHSAEERCCRSLLTTQDRFQSDEFALRHEFVASMLGVRRPTITLVFAT
jgi:hypothetical protein